MAMEVADQDDILFADLSKQISLLIMDDDADHLPYPPVTYQVSMIHQLMYKKKLRLTRIKLESPVSLNSDIMFTNQLS